MGGKEFDIDAVTNATIGRTLSDKEVKGLKDRTFGILDEVVEEARSRRDQGIKLGKSQASYFFDVYLVILNILFDWAKPAFIRNGKSLDNIRRLATQVIFTLQTGAL